MGRRSISPYFAYSVLFKCKYLLGNDDESRSIFIMSFSLHFSWCHICIKPKAAGKIKMPIVSPHFSLRWFFRCQDLSINQINTSNKHKVENNFLKWCLLACQYLLQNFRHLAKKKKVTIKFHLIFLPFTLFLHENKTHFETKVSKALSQEEVLRFVLVQDLV